MNDDSNPLLTDRQIDILQLLAEGGSPLNISQRLTVHQSTIRRDLQGIYDKLGTNGLCHAVALAVRLELITPHVDDAIRRHHSKEAYQKQKLQGWLPRIRSPRRREIFVLLARIPTPTNEELSFATNLGYDTVRSHLRTLYKELDVSGPPEEKRNKLVELAQQSQHKRS